MNAAGQIRPAGDWRNELRRGVEIVHAPDPVPRDDELDSHGDDRGGADVADGPELLEGERAVLGDAGLTCKLTRWQ